MARCVRGLPDRDPGGLARRPECVLRRLSMDATATLSQTPGPAESSGTDVLFRPYRLGPFEVPHRIVRAPLTRARSPGDAHRQSRSAGPIAHWRPAQLRRPDPLLWRRGGRHGLTLTGAGPRRTAQGLWRAELAVSRDSLLL